MESLLPGGRKEKLYFWYLAAFVGLFGFNETLRLFFMPEKFAPINIIFIGAVFYLLGRYFLQNRLDWLGTYLALGFTGLVMLTAFFQGQSMGYLVLVFCVFCLPLLFLNIKLDPDGGRMILDYSTLILSIICLGVLGFGIIDYFSKAGLQFYLAEMLAKTEFGELILDERGWEVYRLYSFIGHPLTNAKYFLLFYIFNQLNLQINRKGFNKYLAIIITGLGLLLSGSKLALLLFLLLILTSINFKKSAWIFQMLVIAGLIFYLSQTVLFQENLGQRFESGMATGDLSTGRNELLAIFFESKIERPSWIIGRGIGYSREIVSFLGGNLTNFEYPLIMLAYDFSILGVIFIYLLVFLRPGLVLWQSKNYFLWWSFLLLFIYDNANNGLASFSDSLAQACFIAIIFRAIAGNVPNKLASQRKNAKGDLTHANPRNCDTITPL